MSSSIGNQTPCARRGQSPVRYGSRGSFGPLPQKTEFYSIRQPAVYRGETRRKPNLMHQDPGIAPVLTLEKVARTLKDRIDHVVSYCYFDGITYAATEGINSKIQSIKRRGGGLRNPNNHKTAIFFYCGGLQVHP